MSVSAGRLVLVRWLAALSLCLPTWCPAAEAQEQTGPGKREAGESGPVRPTSVPGADPRRDDETGRDERFKKLVTNMKLAGHFTIDGQQDTRPQEEEYVITGAMKLGAADLWVLTARIKYGTRDVTVPVPVQVKWAGDTPVIALDKVGIPGLGTFSARVVLDQERYAGTWSHDQVGGHLFGRIAPVDAGDAEKSSPPKDAAPAGTEPGRSSAP